MLNFAIWRPFCFLAAILFFIFFSKFVWTVHTKSGLCSSRWASSAQFCDLAAILFFGGHFVFLKKSKFGQTVHTNFHAKSGLYSSRNEQVMLNFVIWRPFCFSKFCQNLFRLSIRTSMQNLESVAQKMSELWHLVRKRTNIYIQVIIQSKLHFSYSRRKNPNKWIFAPAMSTLYLFLCDTYNRTETLVYIFKIESF